MEFIHCEYCGLPYNTYHTCLRRRNFTDFFSNPDFINSINSIFLDESDPDYSEDELTEGSESDTSDDDE